MKTRVKICCISSLREAAMAIEAGASAIGLVGPMPSGPGVITDELIFQIARSVPPPLGTFLLTSETSAEKIISHHKRTLTNTIQLVDSLPEGTYHQLRNALPAIKLVQVIHVLNEASVDEAIAVSEHVDAILLDSGNPNLKVKILGGTGITHNWKLSRKICESINIPVFLAGGLNPGNVWQAIDEVQPFGVDVCSGLRTDGKLDQKKLDKFISEVHRSYS